MDPRRSPFTQETSEVGEATRRLAPAARCRGLGAPYLRNYTLPYKRALVVGCHVLVIDKQGTPVKFRDGPAAVTECYKGT